MDCLFAAQPRGSATAPVVIYSMCGRAKGKHRQGGSRVARVGLTLAAIIAINSRADSVEANSARSHTEM
jgi:hypothetical protein